MVAIHSGKLKFALLFFLIVGMVFLTYTLGNQFKIFPVSVGTPAVTLSFFLGMLNLTSLMILFLVSQIWNWIDSLAAARQQEQARWLVDAIIVPVCVDPLRDFVLETTDGVRKLARQSEADEIETRKKSYHAFYELFKWNLDNVRDRMGILEYFNAEYFNKIDASLVEIEDVVTNHCTRRVSEGTLNIEERQEANESNVTFELLRRFGEMVEMISKIAGSKKR